MSIIKKCQDLMIGIAIGDAFGAGYENLSMNQIKEVLNLTKYDSYRFNSGHKAGDYTDDTQMSIAVAKTLYSNNFNLLNLANSFLEEYNTNKIIGYSKDNLYLLNSKSGENFLKKLIHSEKNGVVMRALPIGINQEIRLVKEYSVINAEVGYNTKSAIASSVAVSLASHYFFHNLGQPKKVFEFCLDNMNEFDKTSLEYLVKVSKMDKLDKELLFGDKYKDYGVPIHGLKTAGAALYITSKYHDNPMETLEKSVLLGGDTDTVASICLGIIYSRLQQGLDWFLFENLRNDSYGRDYIKTIGTRLATILPINVKSIRRLNYSGERKSMITQSLDGLVETMDPVYLNQIMKQLFNQIEYKQDDIILAIDSSGYIPAVAASMITGLRMATSKKADLDISNKIKFLEPGTPNPNVFIYSIPSDSRVIIIDDEIMTGRTIINAIEAINQKGNEILAIVVPVESTAYKAREKFIDLGIPLVSHTKHNLA